jgi:glutathione S-transferase
VHNLELIHLASTVPVTTDFNNAQRAHLNYVEGAATAMVAFLVSGLYQPRLAALLAFTYIIGRAAYTGGYKLGGPKGRMVRHIET